MVSKAHERDAGFRAELVEPSSGEFDERYGVEVDQATPPDFCRCDEVGAFENADVLEHRMPAKPWNDLPEFCGTAPIARTQCVQNCSTARINQRFDGRIRSVLPHTANIR